MLVYIRFGGRTFQLPYTSDAGGKPNTLDFYLAPGEIRITRFTHDDSASIGIGSGLQYRYVIIPEAEVLTAAGQLTGSIGDLPETSDLRPAFGVHSVSVSGTECTPIQAI